MLGKTIQIHLRYIFHPDSSVIILLEVLFHTRVCVARELNAFHVEKSAKKKRQTIPEKIRKSVSVRAWKYVIPAAQKNYPDYKFA